MLGTVYGTEEVEWGRDKTWCLAPEILLSNFSDIGKQSIAYTAYYNSNIFSGIWSSILSSNQQWFPDFPDGSVVKTLPHNAGDMGLTPGSGTKILHAAEQLSLHHNY